jgi:hypothetical protein
MKKVGFIDARRPTVGGIPAWGEAPALLIPGQLQGYGIYEEFLGVTELAAPVVPGWRLDVFGGGGALSLADVRGGNVLFQTNGANNDSGQLTLGDAVHGAFFPEAGKDIWYEAKMKHSYSEADENIAFGLIDPSVGEYLDDDGGGLNIANHLLFVVLDGEALWYFQGDKTGTTDKNSLATAPVDLALHTFGFHVRGVTAVDVYYDRALIAAGQVLTASIPVTGLMPFFAIKAGSGHVEAVYFDYIMCVQKR